MNNIRQNVALYITIAWIYIRSACSLTWEWAKADWTETEYTLVITAAAVLYWFDYHNELVHSILAVLLLFFATVYFTRYVHRRVRITVQRHTHEQENSEI